jgi:iron complex outermembrane receptor protein
MVGSGEISLIPFINAELGFIGKYVGKQYLDNTSNENRRLNAFYTQDARLIYTISKNQKSKRWMKEVNIILQANNILDAKYEPNGYTFSYYFGGSFTTENFYYPMAGRNFMAAVNIKL